jgi:hypothetical protein
VRDKGNSGRPVNRECKREVNDSEIQMWERIEREQVLEGRFTAFNFIYRLIN